MNVIAGLLDEAQTQAIGVMSALVLGFSIYAVHMGHSGLSA